jgi:hypothetical protein
LALDFFTTGGSAVAPAVGNDGEFTRPMIYAPNVLFTNVIISPVSTAESRDADHTNFSSDLILVS